MRAPIIFMSTVSFTYWDYLGRRNGRRVGENNNAAPKIWHHFFFKLSQFWTFLYCSPYSYCYSNSMIAKVVAINFLASLLVLILCISIGDHSSNYRDTDSTCISFSFFRCGSNKFSLSFCYRFKGQTIATTIAKAIVEKP